MSDMFAMLMSLYNVLFSVQKDCNIHDLAFEVLNWCDVNDCNSTAMFQNAISKIFVITGNANSIASSMYDKPPAITNTTAVFNLY